MLQAGKAVKVSIYLSEGATYHGCAAESAILDFLFFRGVAGATVLRGVAGFGADHHLHSSSFVEISDKLPIKVEFIESEEKVNDLLGKLNDMTGTGLIEVQETRVIKPAASSKMQANAAAPVAKIEGKAKLIRVYVGEDDKWNGKPLYSVLIEAMRANDLAGATAYKGFLGFGAHRRVHRDKPFHLSHDSTIMISVVDSEARLNAFLPTLESMVKEGLIVLSDVDVIKYSHRPMEAEQEGR